MAECLALQEPSRKDFRNTLGEIARLYDVLAGHGWRFGPRDRWQVPGTPEKRC
jgi:hypothetical protein